MSSSLKNKAVTGMIWSAVERISTLGIQLLITILIARKLSPSDFGLIGMLTIFTALGGVILDSGFGQALIRKQNVTQLDYSSVFYLNIFLGILIYGILYFVTPIISDFYHTPQLTNIGRVIFLIFPINAFGLIHNTIVNKNVNFKILAKVSFSAAIVSGIIGIIIAYNGFGVWALVFQALTFAIVKTIALWIFNKWLPTFEFSKQSIRNVFSFSLKLLSTDVIIVIFNNLFTLLIGKVYPISQVGFYNQAKTFVDIPSQTLTAIVQRVTYPLLSTIQDDNLKLRETYRRVIGFTVYLNFPLMLGLLACGQILFSILLTDKWNQSVPYFQLLCIYGALFPLHSINVNILKVKEKGNILLILEIVRRTLMILFILFTLKKGVGILLIGFILSSLISILINMYYCGKVINLTLLTQIKDVFPYLFSSILTALCVWLAGFLPINIYLILIIQVLIGIGTYILLSILLNLTPFYEIKNIINSIFKNFRNEK